MAAGHFDILAPLPEFQWDGTAFSLASGLWIRALSQKPDLRGMDQSLGEDEQNNVSFARFWLMFEWTSGAQPSPAETANLVLLALWLVKPTKTHNAYRFHLGQGGLAAEKSRHRLLDRFSWVQGGVHDEFNDGDLQSAAQYYSALRSACLARGRLNDALILTLTGCWSHRWQAALISHAAAAEALLTYSTKPGITSVLTALTLGLWRPGVLSVHQLQEYGDFDAWPFRRSPPPNPEPDGAPASPPNEILKGAAGRPRP